MSDYNDNNMLWKVRKSEYIFQRPWLNIRQDSVELPNGKVYDDFYVLHYPTWVNVIAITESGEFILERQYRHAIAKVCTEICAGCAEDGEDPLTAAKRELAEETGYSDGTWTELMTIAPNGTSMDNICHCFLAEGVKKVSGQHLDETEDIKVFLRSKDEVYQMLLNGEFIHSLMCAPLWKYFATKG
jgi:8-oxo-dGTP pyrophosphatase MutT (NUDIX family)